MGAIAAIGNGFMWGIEKTIATPSGIIKFNKLVNIINAYVREVFPQLANIKFMAVYYEKFDKPVQPMLETLSAWLAFFPCRDKYRAFNGDFKSSVEFAKSVLGLWAACFEAYIAETKIGTTGVSPLGLIANTFGSFAFFAKTQAETMKGRFFLGVAFCDLLTIGQKISDTYQNSTSSTQWSNWFTLDFWRGKSNQDIQWGKLLAASYAVMTDSKILLTSAGNAAKIWLILFPPQWKAFELSLVIFVHSTGYVKYLITPLRVSI